MTMYQNKNNPSIRCEAYQATDENLDLIIHKSLGRLGRSVRYRLVEIPSVYPDPAPEEPIFVSEDYWFVFYGNQWLVLDNDGFQDKFEEVQ